MLVYRIRPGRRKKKSQSGARQIVSLHSFHTLPGRCMSDASGGAMKYRSSGARVLLGSILSVVCVVTASAAGWKVPRTPDGKPDLQGNWTNATLTQLERSPAQGDRKVLTAEEA